MRQVNKLLLLGIAVTSLTACEAIKPPRPNDPKFSPVAPVMPHPVRSHNGGIYNNGNAIAFFETLRARRVGDMLTINLEEKTDASKKAETKGTKNNLTDVKNAILFGKPVSFGADRTLEAKLEANRIFAGNGESKQNNTLRGQITVTVFQVLPNGYLKVRGEKWLRLNQGDEYIRLTGIVRPVDIRPDNTLSSYQIANARISYSGTGQVSDTNAQGWLSRFFNTQIWPY